MSRQVLVQGGGGKTGTGVKMMVDFLGGMERREKLYFVVVSFGYCSIAGRP